MKTREETLSLVDFCEGRKDGERGISLVQLSGRENLGTEQPVDSPLSPHTRPQNPSPRVATWTVQNGRLAVLGGASGDSQAQIWAVDSFCPLVFGYIFKLFQNAPGRDIGVCTLVKLKDLG